MLGCDQDDHTIPKEGMRMESEHHQKNLEDLEADYYKRLILWLQDVTRQIESLQAEREQLEAQVSLIGTRRPKLRRMYDSQDDQDRKLRGREAVLEVLRAEGDWMTVREIVEELQLRNWMALDAKAPNEAARVSLRRLEEEGAPIVRKRSGRRVSFHFKKSEAPEGASDVHSEGSPDGPAS